MPSRRRRTPGWEPRARLVESKRERPGADIPSRLLAHPSNLTNEEIALDLAVVIAAAHQPTMFWIGNTVRLMLTDVRFATNLSGGRASVAQALNEGCGRTRRRR